MRDSGDGYSSSALRQVISVSRLVTIHYYEFHKDYVFEGESHDFWEIAYVDKGEAVLTADDEAYLVTAGEMLFHRPHEFHTVRGNGVSAFNLIIVSFETNSPAMRFFEKRIVIAGRRERAMLSRIIAEGQGAYVEPLYNPGLKKLTRRKEAPFGAEQIIKLSIESMLIGIVRDGASISKKERLSYTMNDVGEQELLERILGHMERNITARLSVDELARSFGVGKTQLKRLFSDRLGRPVIRAFNDMKMEEAKRMIREERHNITEIAERLGYSSVHYFSRSFKRDVGMSPTEYAASVKARALL